MRDARAASASSWYLSEAERLHIADRFRERATVRAIAAELGRSPSTISREIRRNGKAGKGNLWHYRPYAAQARADARRPTPDARRPTPDARRPTPDARRPTPDARRPTPDARRLRPKQGKIDCNPELRDAVQAGPDQRWSPKQMCHALRKRFPDRPEMHVVHETVYQALHVQGRGELRREPAGALRTGRARRKPHHRANCRRPRFVDPMVMISDRPAEADNRAVPGHWEGDRIVGRNNGSAIGTPVERATRYVMLVHLPHGRMAKDMNAALHATIRTLPRHLTRSPTWDQGAEMAGHRAFSPTDIPVYFRDPGSPRRRGSNENTNGLLRQYFPEGTDLSVHTREHPDLVAAQLNSRPRKTLGW